MQRLKGSSNLEFSLSDISRDVDKISNEMKDLKLRLERAKQRRFQAHQRRIEIAKNLNEACTLRDNIFQTMNKLENEKSLVIEQKESIENELNVSKQKQEKYMRMSSLNDAFFIWYNGPFATINSFRLGSLPLKPVEWTEINAALGQAVLVVAIIALRSGIEFKKYGLVPMGSFSKVFKMEDRRTLLSLYTDGSFSLFPKRNFNAALVGFVSCIYELGEYIKSHDPTYGLPNAIDLKENTINEVSILLANDDEIWTRALKFLLSDIKWIIAWYTKHYNNHIRGI